MKFNPCIGDLICYNPYDEESELGIIINILDPIQHWSKGLGVYPDHVFLVITNLGIVKVWDFFNLKNEIPELKILSKIAIVNNDL